MLASPPLGDPNFERTVVLMAMHSDRGALGFVINRVAPLKIGDVLGLAGYGDALAKLPGRVLVGGPVEPGSGWVFTRGPSFIEGVPGVIELGNNVRISSSRVAFDKLAGELAREAESGEPVRNTDRVVVLGYSGWGPGQLEGEIAQGAWLPVPLDEAVIFDVELDARWQDAHARNGLTPLQAIGMRTVGDA